MRTLTAGLILIALLPGAYGSPAGTSDALEEIEREPNRLRRAKLALDHAGSCIDRAARAYSMGDLQQGEALLLEVQTAVEFAKESLDATGKNPSRKPKHFKRAEIATRKLMGRLDDLEVKLGFDERDTLQAVRSRVSEINVEILMGIMAKKKQPKNKQPNQR